VRGKKDQDQAPDISRFPSKEQENNRTEQADRNDVGIADGKQFQQQPPSFMFPLRSVKACPPTQQLGWPDGRSSGLIG
jgi:hypothetical protein